jgi:hypothetical protein
MQRLPNRQHHCMAVFAKPRFDVSETNLPCAPDACYVNLVASAWNPHARPDDKLLIGASQPHGIANLDRGRINVTRLRPDAPGPTPQGKVRTYKRTRPVTRELKVGDESGLNRTVVFSQRLRGLAASAQLAVTARVRTDLASLPYNALIKSHLILGTSRRAPGPTGVAKEVALSKGDISEGNGFNCTRSTTPCPTTKVGVSRMLADARDASGEPVPLFVNLTVGTKALRAQPHRGDVIDVLDGALKVVRYPATRSG